MATKRTLYRPAPQEQSIKQKRKPLAQGRLVSGSDAQKKSHPTLVSGVEESTTTNRVPPSSHRSQVQASLRPKQDISNIQESFLTTTDQESFVLTPRRRAPRLLEQTSPVVNRPARTLDLSDSDTDISQQYKSPGIMVHSHRPQEVLTIDASRQTKNPDESEVDIRVGFERSPVRVVCHAPASVEAGLRNTSLNGNKKVTTETVQGMGLSTRLDSGDTRNVGLDGILTQMEKDLKAQQCQLQVPNFNDSGDSYTLNTPTHVRKDVENIDPDNSDTSDLCSLNEYVTSKDQSAVRKVYSSKKKKARIVPSRYLQAAVSKAKTAKQDKTAKGSSFEVANKPMKQPIIRKTAKDKIKSSHTTQSEERPCTPENPEVKAGGKTSTPTLDGSIFPQEIDASAINMETSVLSTGNMSRSVRTPKGNKRKIGSTNSKAKDVHDTFSHSILSNISVKPEKSFNPMNQKEAQHHLDLLYNRYLQWLFLATRARKNRQETEKQAMAHMLGLHKEVEKMRKKKHDLELELSRLQHLNLLDEQTDLQRQCLGPITSNLTKLTTEYEDLAHALDTTRHQIPTKGVYLPDDDEQMQRVLEQELRTSEQLLGELSTMIRRPVTTVTNMSKAMNAMEKSVEAQTHNLKGCTELLAAAKSLTMQESCLQIQSIQTQDNPEFS